MPKILITFLILFSLQNIRSQNLTNVDRVVAAIPENVTATTVGISSFIKEHFVSDTERLRAIFVWVANNINYDIVKFNARNNSLQPVEDILKSRYAVCKGYSDLFIELSNQCNLTAMPVMGYTQHKGVVAPVSHVWAAVKLDQEWYLFDPTWAAGYVLNNKFTRNFSNTYYKVPPYEMIKDHMPFDPMFQFLSHTITNREFIDGKKVTKNEKALFNFADSLKIYALLSQQDKAFNELCRIQSIGVENDIIKERADYLKTLLEYHSSKKSYELSMDLYNQSVSLFNKYIGIKNGGFKEVKSDNEIKLMIDSIASYISTAWNLLGTALPKDEQSRTAISSAYRLLDKFQNRVNQEKEFVTGYIR
ncbi:MAG: transglutaminase domain-containing protein [Chitinophagaceae bacterium]